MAKPENRQFFEIAFIIPFAAPSFQKIRDFVHAIRRKFSETELPEILIYSWIGSNTLGIILRFHALTFYHEHLDWFTPWTRDLKLNVIELESLGPEKKTTLLKKFDLTSDVKFKGGYNIETALRQVADRFTTSRGIRKHSRVASRVKVQGKTEKDVMEEYAENISMGGMFVRGRTDLPLGTRLEMEISLPGGGRILAIAEVAHIVTEEKASLIDGDTVPGCGLRFVEFFKDGAKRLKEYLESVSG